MEEILAGADLNLDAVIHALSEDLKRETAA